MSIGSNKLSFFLFLYFTMMFIDLQLAFVTYSEMTLHAYLTHANSTMVDPGTTFIHRLSCKQCKFAVLTEMVQDVNALIFFL